MVHRNILMITMYKRYFTIVNHRMYFDVRPVSP